MGEETQRAENCRLDFGFILLVLYVVILGLATVSELLDLGWFDWLAI